MGFGACCSSSRGSSLVAAWVHARCSSSSIQSSAVTVRRTAVAAPRLFALNFAHLHHHKRKNLRVTLCSFLVNLSALNRTATVALSSACSYAICKFTMSSLLCATTDVFSTISSRRQRQEPVQLQRKSCPDLQQPYEREGGTDRTTPYGCVQARTCSLLVQLIELV
jgi:hypothetical protein